MSVALTRKFDRLSNIIEKYKRNPSNLVAILQELQAEYRYLPEEVLTYVATSLGLPPATVFGVATFYSQFSMSPKGHYVIKVCDGTACHVRGSEAVRFAIREKVGLGEEEDTTSDLMFTVERVACLGACGLAPVVMVNDREVYGQMTAEEAEKLVDRLKQARPLAVTTSVSDGTEIVSPREDEAYHVPGHLPLPLGSRAALVQLQSQAKQVMDAPAMRLLVCMETACIASGAEDVYRALKREIATRGLSADVEKLEQGHGGRAAQLVKAGCHGYCQIGPLVRVEPLGILYCHVKPEDAKEIVETTVENGQVVSRLLYASEEGHTFENWRDIPFYAKQHKRVLAHCGEIDCEDIREYIAIGGYQALAKAIFDMEPAEVVSLIKESGLRGRGGAGFLTGTKWELAAQAKGDKKFIVCNGDEGDPGAFMDRSVMEGDPHRVLEGMAIAAYAIGANEGFIYVRAEYPLAVKRLQLAVEEANRYGLLGDNILGSNFSFQIKIKEGAGAFVCGEETALLASIEGKRGMPRPRPPFPVKHGLWGCPTVINNVETLANVPSIILEGPRTFSAIGTPKSPGTKTFSLAGQVARTGLIEVPLGTTLREIVFDIGGGMREGKAFKAVQIGGPSGGCLTANHLDLPLDFDSLAAAGAMVGSGGLVVMGQDTCMVEVAKFFMTFIQSESCGKCLPCREGTKQILAILTRITEGKGRPEDIDLLLELAHTLKKSALCGLGKTAANPVLTTLRYFRHEYESHVVDKHCPAGVCKALAVYQIDPEKCNGCGGCRRICPTGAISGALKHPFTIDPSRCTKCGSCLSRCRYGAIVLVH